MTKLETMLLGVAGGALLVVYVGAVKLIVGALLVAAGSVVWRRFVWPYLQRL